MLRKIAKDDIENIYRLGSKFDAKFESKYNLDSYIQKDIYIINVYEECGKVVGFIISTNLNKSVEILLIYVDENYRNQKIGQKLLSSVETDVTEVSLEVSKENEIALHLYKKNGYKIIAIREKYYNGIDAYIMKKVLK